MSDTSDPPKLNRHDLLSELFSLLQQVENGQLKPQDFDKNTGSIRLSLNNIRSAVQESEGIHESVEERQKRIQALKVCSEKKAAFLSRFRQRVTSDLDREKTENQAGAKVANEK